MRRPFLALALSVCSFVGLAAPASGQTITDIVASSGGEFDNNRYDFDILLNAVLTAELDGALAELEGLTVFAPSDAAFIRLARDLGYNGFREAGAWEFLVAALTDLGGGDPIPVLTDILLYHVVPAEATAFDFIIASFRRMQLPTLLDGAFLTPRFLRVGDNDPDLRDPYLNIFQLNIRADNGIIHGITRVLIPVDL